MLQAIQKIVKAFSAIIYKTKKAYLKLGKLTKHKIFYMINLDFKIHYHIPYDNILVHYQALHL